MHIHILGICGTFMGGIAILARQLGHKVTGCDENVYPPMSTTLEAAGITIQPGFSSTQLTPKPDQVIVGNAISRGNPLLEAVLDQGLPYISGPQWLAENVLHDRHVLAVAGTHGKTTTTSLLTWILSQANLSPGYLIGGVPHNFNQTAELGASPYFVIEADEYDTAFYDKRSKFMHYCPRTLILNNLEYDHADIFPDVEAIKKQFQFLLRTVPASGTVIYNAEDHELKDVISRGCWSSLKSFGLQNGEWKAVKITDDWSEFSVFLQDEKVAEINWGMLGHHNAQNALAAITAAYDIDISLETIIGALNSFGGVKRRLELVGKVNNISVYDDFAHHPTAIEATLSALRARVGKERIIAVLQFGSNTMSQGLHGDKIAASLAQADQVFMLRPDNAWNIEGLTSLKPQSQVFNEVSDIVNHLVSLLQPSDHVLIMSNKGFGGIHQKIVERLRKE